MIYDHAYIPLVFSQCFMHLNVCLIVENCVLVGLDWVSTHDTIILSMSHVHAYFMHSYHLFIYFFTLLWLCSVSVSVSVSLSRGLRMAPKRKSNLTRNPFRFGSSSSSNLLVPPLHVQFHDEKASKRGVHPECHVILYDFGNTPLPDVIHTQGWESLCEIPLRYLIVFI